MSSAPSLSCHVSAATRKAVPKPAELEAIAEPWRPYRTRASLYLWRSLDNQPAV